MKKLLVFFATLVLVISMVVLAINGKRPSVAATDKVLVEPDPPFIPVSHVVPAPQTAALPDLTMAAEKSVHAVVHILTEYEQKGSMYDYFFRDFFGHPNYDQRRAYTASGSGVIISDDGYIVTNNHVVQDADRIEVTLNDKRTYEAQVVGTDPSSDLAIIRIAEEGLPAIRFGNSDALKVGEWILAVGNPFNLTSTVTAGIVSAKARNIHILPDPEGGSALESFIQTDAAVNPGNSGGALVNSRGELVGVNAAIASGTGYYTGYSFAIPVSIVRKVANDIIAYGEVQRAVLGVTIRELNSELAQQIGHEGLNGVYVVGLSHRGGAKAAGIEAGDVILTIDDVAVNSTSQLMEEVGQHSPGDEVQVLVNRNGKNRRYTVQLQNLNERNGFGREEWASGQDDSNTELGVLLEDLSPEEREAGLPSGVKVVEVFDGKLKRAGVKEGYLITHIDGEEVKDSAHFYKMIAQKRGGVLIEGIYPGGIRAYYGMGL
ncbi:MAG: deoxyribonuclease HsdR [Bacteroidetes bacterium]|nr:MAG: deoxyribonuclease HsdR [Bacteroidota bacterium]